MCKLFAPNRLREIRESRNFRMVEVAAALDIAVMTISNHENRKTEVTLPLALAYAALYRVKAHELWVEPTPINTEEPEVALAV